MLRLCSIFNPTHLSSCHPFPPCTSSKQGYSACTCVLFQCINTDYTMGTFHLSIFRQCLCKFNKRKFRVMMRKHVWNIQFPNPATLENIPAPNTPNGKQISCGYLLSIATSRTRLESRTSTSIHVVHIWGWTSQPRDGCPLTVWSSTTLHSGS